MTYEDALKASENGQNVMIWTGEEYLHPEYVKQTLDNLSTVQISHERLRSLLKASVSDDWEIYTKESLEWETGYYRKRYERLNHIQNDFLKDPLGRNRYNDYTNQYFSERMIAVDAFYTLYSLKRNQKILLFTTIVFLATTIIALMV
jgi:hypothetical protein